MPVACRSHSLNQECGLLLMAVTTMIMLARLLKLLIVSSRLSERWDERFNTLYLELKNAMLADIMTSLLMTWLCCEQVKLLYSEQAQFRLYTHHVTAVATKSRTVCLHTQHDCGLRTCSRIRGFVVYNAPSQDGDGVGHGKAELHKITSWKIAQLLLSDHVSWT